jgi:PadR family transcriptional regulator, regulatory protein PadR
LGRSDARQSRIEVLQGTLDLIILQTLQWGPRHGYGISRAIQTGSGDLLRVDTGSLYPALHRLERQGWIAAEWKTSENKQRVRVYRLTAAGKRQLVKERSWWEQLSGAIAGLLKPVPGRGEA